MKKSEQLTDSMFYIMAALTKPRHGYAIMSLIEETTDGVITIGPASMYTIIKRLLTQEWIYLHDGSDSRRKTYLLTENGRKVLEVDLKLRKQMIQLAETGLEEVENETNKNILCLAIKLLLPVHEDFYKLPEIIKLFETI